MFTSARIKLILVLSVALVIMGNLGWLNPVKDFAVWLTQPVFSVSRAATSSITNSVSNVFSIRDLQAENAHLRERLILLETENALLKSDAQNYQYLEEALNFKSQSGYVLTAGRVVSADPTGLNQILLIDRGSNAGIATGQAAVNSAGTYVGRVTRVLRNTAEITLISDVRSRLPSEVLESGARGIVNGQHGISITLKEVPQGEELSVGAQVLTGGFTPGVPAGLLIGHIEAVISDPTDLFQEALIRSASELRQLRTVFVITGTN